MVLCLVEVRFVPKASRACQRGFADHSILPCSHLPASQRLPSAGAEDFGMGDEPWQRERAGRKRTACLCYVLAHPSREMLTDEGTPPWKLNQPLPRAALRTRALLDSALDLVVLEGSEMRLERPPFTASGKLLTHKMLKSFRICSARMEELSFSCFGKAQGEPRVTEPGFVYVCGWLVPCAFWLAAPSWLAALLPLTALWGVKLLPGSTWCSHRSLARAAQEPGKANSKELLLSLSRSKGRLQWWLLVVPLTFPPQYWWEQLVYRGPNAAFCPRGACEKLLSFAAFSAVSWTGLPCMGFLSSYSLNIIHPKISLGFVLSGSTVQNLQAHLLVKPSDGLISSAVFIVHRSLLACLWSWVSTFASLCVFVCVVFLPLWAVACLNLVD